MKKIEPISIWQNGETKIAEILSADAINDNLKDSAIFFYSLETIENEKLSQGNLTMSGQEYNGYTSNEYAYDWIAEQLNLVIINNLGIQ